MLLITGCAEAPAGGATDRAPTAPSGIAGPGLERFDAIISGLIREFDIPGAGFALVYNGRLVLAHGYGWADVEAGQPVEPTTRFLLASVSKSITAATILKLVQDGRLRLDDKVFSILADIPPPPGGVADPRSADITVRQLLYHKDGGVMGTTTWVEHDPKGVDWVLLFNGSKGQPEGPELHQEFQHEIRVAIAATTTWPDIDLFDRYR